MIISVTMEMENLYIALTVAPYEERGLPMWATYSIATYVASY